MSKIFLNITFAAITVVITVFLLISCESLFFKMGWGIPFMEFRIFGYIPAIALIILNTVHINMKWGKKNDSFITTRFPFQIAIGLFFIWILSGAIEVFLSIASLLFASITDNFINSANKHT